MMWGDLAFFLMEIGRTFFAKSIIFPPIFLLVSLKKEFFLSKKFWRENN